MAIIGVGVIDTPALLDTSRVGVEAAKELERAWSEAKNQPEEQKRELLGQLEARRTALRQQLLARARPIVAELAKKKNLSLVVEKSVVAFSEVDELTNEVIARVDALGPL